MKSSNFIQNVCFITLLYVITTISADYAGSKCQMDDDCFDDLSCEYSQCDCRQGFIQNGTQCYPVAGFMEICLFDDQCLDKRQVCISISGEMRCICQELYEYDMENNQCVINENIIAMLGNNEEVIGSLKAAENRIFSVIMILGYCITAVCVTGFIIALIYCCKMNRSDKKMDKELKLLIEKAEREKKTKKFKTIEEVDEEQVQPYTEASMMPNIITMDMVMA